MYNSITLALQNFNEYKVYETILYAKKTEKSYICSNNILPKSDGYFPIGLYVVPEEHVGDGKHRFVSLRYMSCNSPGTGSVDDATMYWGNRNVDLPDLTNKTRVPKYITNDLSFKIKTTSLVDDSVSEVKTVVARRVNNISPTEFSFLPMDKDGLVGVQDPLNSKLRYYYQSYDPSEETFNVDYATRMCPAPFLEDGSQNMFYRSVDINNNCLNDFDGIGNTDTLIRTDVDGKYAAEQPNWLTDEKITNSYDPGYSPAACCCRRYNPDGYSKMEWYFPATGELGYVCVHQKRINSLLTLIRAVYAGDMFSNSLVSHYHWSSSEYSALVARGVGFNSGYVYSFSKSRAFRVLAFVSEYSLSSTSSEGISLKIHRQIFINEQ